MLIIAAGIFGLLSICAVLAADLGMIYLERRKAQAAVDLAAISAASRLDRAEEVARVVLADNGIAQFSTLDVVVGRYSADASIVPGSRFVAGAAPSNAVRVALRKNAPLFFGGSIVGSDTIEISVQAIGTATDLAEFTIGSRLLSLNEGIGNTLLGQTLGTTISLNALDYRALASADVNLLEFFDAVAASAEIDALTYNDILNADVAYSDVVGGLMDTAGLSAAVAVALQKLSGGVSASTKELTLGDAVDLGPYAALETGSSPSGMDLQVPMLPLLTAAAMAAGGGSQVSLDLTANVPGVLSALLDIRIGEPAQHSSWLAVGPEGATVHTAQLRLGLSVEAGGTGLLGAYRLRLPVLAEVAQATGRIDAIACRGLDPESVDIAATSGIVNAWIGDLDPYDLATLSSATVRKADIITAPLLTVTGRASVSVEDEEEILTFSADDIDDGIVQTVSTSDVAGSLVSSLIEDLTLGVKLLGFDLGIEGATRLQLGKLAAPADNILRSLLDLFGIGIGEADISVLGVRCGGPGLVG